MTPKILGVICARGGSTGVPGKNIMNIAGKPLIGWSVETALADPRITDVIVSTDDQKISEVAKEFGAQVPFLRPQELATSAAGKFGVWKHALAECENINNINYDIFIDIDCTTPLLDRKDLSGIIDAYFIARDQCNIDGIFTVSPSHRSPYFNLVEEGGDGCLSLSKKLNINIEARQASPKTLDIVAGFYVFATQYIRNGAYLLDGRLYGYEIPREKSFDIDDPFDAKLVNWLMEEKHGAS